MGICFPSQDQIRVITISAVQSHGYVLILDLDMVCFAVKCLLHGCGIDLVMVDSINYKYYIGWLTYDKTLLICSP